MGRVEIQGAVELSILEYVRTRQPVREKVFSYLQWSYPRQQVQGAFTRLRKEGIIYRVSEGWYQTDWSVDNVLSGFRMEEKY